MEAGPQRFRARTGRVSNFLTSRGGYAADPPICPHFGHVQDVACVERANQTLPMAFTTHRAPAACTAGARRFNTNVKLNNDKALENPPKLQLGAKHVPILYASSA